MSWWLVSPMRRINYPEIDMAGDNRCGELSVSRRSVDLQACCYDTDAHDLARVDCSNHVRHVRRACWVGVQEMLQIRRLYAGPDRQGKEVDEIGRASCRERV